MIYSMAMLATTVLAASNRSCVVTDRSDAPDGQAAGVTLRYVEPAACAGMILLSEPDPAGLHGKLSPTADAARKGASSHHSHHVRRMHVLRGRRCIKAAYSPPYGATTITFNIPSDADEVGPAYVTVALGGPPLNLSAPVSTSDPVAIIIDGTTQPDDALDPHRRDPITTPKVAICPANDGSAPAAAFVLGDGGPGSVSGTVTLRGLMVAGFGAATAANWANYPAIGGGVAVVRVWPSLTIEAGCVFENNLPAAVAVVGAEGVPAGRVLVQHAAISPASAGAGVLVALAFHGSLSLSSVSVTGGSVGVRVQSADANIRLTNVTVSLTALIGLRIAAAGTAIVGGAVSGCGGEAGIVLDSTAVGSTVAGTVVRDNAGNGIDVYANCTAIVDCVVLGNGDMGVYLEDNAVESTVTGTVVGNNTGRGIFVVAARTRIENCSACGNGKLGIYLFATAADSNITGTVAGNNTAAGIASNAPRTVLMNCSVGVSFDGAPCGNGADGVVLYTDAVDSVVTGTVAGNNVQDGIATLAPRTVIANCSVGVSFAGAPCGNGAHGIILNPTAADSNVTGTVAGNNVQDGIATLAPRMVTANCSVGVSLDGAPCGNGQHGIYLNPDAIDSVVMGTVAGNNTLAGISTLAAGQLSRTAQWVSLSTARLAAMANMASTWNPTLLTALSRARSSGTTPKTAFTRSRRGLLLSTAQWGSRSTARLAAMVNMAST